MIFSFSWKSFFIFLVLSSDFFWWSSKIFWLVFLIERTTSKIEKYHPTVEFKFEIATKGYFLYFKFCKGFAKGIIFIKRWYPFIAKKGTFAFSRQYLYPTDLEKNLPFFSIYQNISTAATMAYNVGLYFQKDFKFSSFSLLKYPWPIPNLHCLMGFFHTD